MPAHNGQIKRETTKVFEQYLGVMVADGIAEESGTLSTESAETFSDREGGATERGQQALGGREADEVSYLNDYRGQ
jgi:hypothetical protein